MKNPHILDLYSDYLISSFKLTTATGMSEVLDGALSHDQITRFLGQDLLTQKTYWKCIKKVIRQIESPEGVIKIDDTILEKPHSTENEIICWHHDHSKKGRDKNTKGINILNFLYQSSLAQVDYLSIPVAYEIIRKTEQWYDKKSKKIKLRSPITKNEMVRERLLILHRYNKVKFKYVLWDTWFSSARNFNFVHYDLKKQFIAALKGNRLTALSEEDRRQGKFQRVDELNIQAFEAMPIWLKGMDFPIKLTKQIFINKDGSRGELYIVTNDLSLTGHLICTIYQDRWSVEVFHKSLKQNVGLEKSPTKVENSQCNHIFAAMIAWTKLEMLSKIQQTNHFDLKAQLYAKALKSAFGILQQLKRVQSKLESTSITTNPLLG